MEQFCESPLWDTNLTWNTDNPDFTPCFKQTVLTWIPCFFLWIFSPWEIYSMKKSQSRDIPLTAYNVTKLGLIIVLIFLALFQIVFSFNENPSTVIQFVTFILFLTLTWNNIKMGIRSSGILFCFSFILLFCGIPQFRTDTGLLTDVENFSIIGNEKKILSLIHYLSVIFLFTLNCYADSAPRYSLCQVNKKTCPKKEASFVSKLYISWFTPFVWASYKKPLDDYLWELSDRDTTTQISAKFEKYLYKKRKPEIRDVDQLHIELKNNSRKTDKTNWNCFTTIFLSDKFTFCKIIGMRILEIFTNMMYPTLFHYFIVSIESKDPAWKLYFWVFLMFINTQLQIVGITSYLQRVTETQIHTKAALTSIIYRKIFRLSNVQHKNYTTSDIINLMTVDVDRMFVLLRKINHIWTSPIVITLCFYYVGKLLGPSCLGSLIVMLIFFFVMHFLTGRIKKLQVLHMKHKDNRGKVVQEILSGIKILKLNAWESAFEEKAFKLREEEFKTLRRNAYLNVCVMFLFSIIPFVLPLVTFAIYIFVDENNKLDSTKAFVTLTYFNTLKSTLHWFPELYSSVMQAVVATKRINKFINSDEKNTKAVSHDDQDKPLIIKNGQFSWTDKGSNILNDINLEIDAGKLVALIGSVGSGKTSLISAFLGQMHKNYGYVNTKGSIAYVPQQPWILNATFKENITLNEPISQEVYEKVLEACALYTDIENMPNGDTTEIGEKGINLSGGQKQRVSIARAICQDRDIYLIDDPLSAVDLHVARHLFDNVLGPNGVLKNKTRIVATHSITFLPQMDYIAILMNGGISDYGTYNELLEKNSNFAEVLKTFSIDPAKGEKEIEKAATRIKIRRNKTTEKNQDKGKLTEQEHLKIGKIKKKVWQSFILSMGIASAGLTIVMYTLYQFSVILSNLWLSKWTNVNDPQENKSTESDNQYFYLIVYTIFGIAQGLASMLGNVFLFNGVLNASKTFYNKLLTNVIRWPMWLFDVIPIGRISNRFTSDIDALDTYVGTQTSLFFIFFFRSLSLYFVLWYFFPKTIFILLPIAILIYVMQKLYNIISLQLRRIESNFKSPLDSHFIQSINGLTSIKAYGFEKKFTTELYQKIDSYMAAFNSSNVSKIWANTRTELISGIWLISASIFIIQYRDRMETAFIAFLMSFAVQIVKDLGWILLYYAEVHNCFVSVERIKEFIDYPTETIQEISYLPAYWPGNGKITFKNYSMRYRKGLDLTLQGLDFTIDGGLKVGIVGRTGAGKSSIISSLFRIVEPSDGKIIIDGVDIATINLDLLRSKLTVIPQDPMLFLGTIRFNLDPLGSHSTEELWAVLEKAYLKEFVSSLPLGLEHNIDEGGTNISFGQRQLICLARALLRKTKILVLDEATASVDLKTDELIQKTIRNEFQLCTVITVAHRINTIQDYDKILVLDNGSVTEFDSPENLMKMENSVFKSLAAELKSSTT